MNNIEMIDLSPKTKGNKFKVNKGGDIIYFS